MNAMEKETLRMFLTEEELAENEDYFTMTLGSMMIFVSTDMPMNPLRAFNTLTGLWETSLTYFQIENTDCLKNFVSFELLSCHCDSTRDQGIFFFLGKKKDAWNTPSNIFICKLVFVKASEEEWVEGRVWVPYKLNKMISECVMQPQQCSCVIFGDCVCFSALLKKPTRKFATTARIFHFQLDFKNYCYNINFLRANVFINSRLKFRKLLLIPKTVKRIDFQQAASKK